MLDRVLNKPLRQTVGSIRTNPLGKRVFKTQNRNTRVIYLIVTNGTLSRNGATLQTLRNCFVL